MPTWLNLIHQPSHVSVKREGVGKGYYSRAPPGDFPTEDGGGPCEVNTHAIYLPDLYKPSALHKVKVKETNLPDRFSQLSGTTAHNMAPAHLQTPRYAAATFRIVMHI